MLRSLFSGISGLSNHLTMLDIVGSNIANVNTIGYKSSRVTFRELLTQTVRGATRPTSGSLGGTNPAQIGLGSTIQSIDPTFTQGNIQTTGKITDLAIEGNGFFVVSDGASRQYTRAGTFAFDGLGQLVTSGTGFTVQGVMAEDDGTIDYGRPLETLRLGNNLVTPAQATESITLAGNLNADADAVGTILRSPQFFHLGRAADTMFGLRSASGADLGLLTGDRLDVNFDIGATNYTTSIPILATDSISNIVSQLNTIAPGQAVFSFDGATGRIQLSALGGDITINQLEVGGRTNFNSALSISGTVFNGTTARSEQLLSPGQPSDLLSDLYNQRGAKLAFTNGDQFTLAGTTGGTNVQQTLTYTPTTTLGDITSAIQSLFGVSNSSGVVVDSEGAIVVNGDPGISQAITQMTMSATSVTSPNTDFTTNFNFTELQKADDAEVWRTTATVFDSLGRDFRIGMTYSKRTGTNLWDWVVDAPQGVTLLQGASGTVGFSQNGLLTSFDFTDSSGALVLDPGNGAQTMRVELSPGNFGGLDGLLQFKGASTATAKDFDGHGAGTLQGVTINTAGILVGQFSNGINRSLGQIALAEFNNPNGLLRNGNNLYTTSSNTGPETITFVGQNATGSIAPGSLEMSNVDLSNEFTQMIIAQRGFQANARVISTGDEMLSELVTLKR